MFKFRWKYPAKPGVTGSQSPLSMIGFFQNYCCNLEWTNSVWILSRQQHCRSLYPYLTCTSVNIKSRPGAARGNGHSIGRWSFGKKLPPHLPVLPGILCVGWSGTPRLGLPTRTSRFLYTQYLPFEPPNHSILVSYSVYRSRYSTPSKIFRRVFRCRTHFNYSDRSHQSTLVMWSLPQLATLNTEKAQKLIVIIFPMLYSTPLLSRQTMYVPVRTVKVADSCEGSSKVYVGRRCCWNGIYTTREPWVIKNIVTKNLRGSVG